MSRERYLIDKSALARWGEGRHQVTVLHYDGDYDMIAAITGQPTRRVAPSGSAD